MIPNLYIPTEDIDNTPAPLGRKRYLLKHIEGTTFGLQIDNSSLEVFNTCPRSAEYALVKGRKVPTSAALTYGSAIHEGLERWYKSFPSLTRENEDDVIRDVLTASQKPFENNSPGLEEWRTPDRAQDTLQRYIKHYTRNEAFDLLTLNDQPAVEIPFSLPLGVVDLGGEHELEYSWADIVDPDSWPSHFDTEDVDYSAANVIVSEIHVYWTGKMDIAASMDGANWVIDHKTSSMVGPTFYNHFQLSGQTVGYTWAAQQIFNQPFAGLMVNVIVGRKPTKTGVPTAFERQRFYYTADRVSEWESNTLTLVSDFMTSLIRNNFPMNPSWCAGKYGMCKYHEVCTLPRNQRSFALSSDVYTDNTWSPLND